MRAISAGRYPTKPPWEHETMSADMFQRMVDDNSIDLDEEVVKRVKNLITSDDSAAPPGKKFLWDIVANKRNSVVGRCRLTGSKPVLKRPMLSALEARI